MTEPAANEILSAYLDGELSDAESAELEARLAADTSLRDELEELRGVQALLRTHGAVSAPRDFHARVMEAVEHEPMPGDWWRFVRRPFGIPIEGLAVAAAAVLVLLYIALPRTQAPLEPADDPKGRSGVFAPSPHDDLDDGRDGVKKSKKASKKKKDPIRKGTDSKKKAPPKDGKTDVPQKLTADGTAEDPVIGSGTAAQSPSGTAAGAPAWAPSPYTYRVRTDDPEVLLRLQRLAGQYQGSLTDGQKRIRGATLSPGHSSLYVQLPSSALSQFARDLEGLGVVTQERSDDDTLYAADRVFLKIDIELDTARKASPPEVMMAE